MNLGEDVVDKQMLDSRRRRSGKVDDLLLVSERGELPVVAGILAQRGALARDLSPLALRIVCWLYRLLGIERCEPVFVDWNLVTKIDVVVHLARTRQDLGMDLLQRVLAERVISKIPGS